MENLMIDNTAEKINILVEARKQIEMKHMVMGSFYGHFKTRDNSRAPQRWDAKKSDLEDGKIWYEGCILAAIFIGQIMVGTATFQQMFSCGDDDDPTMQLFGSDALLAEAAYECAPNWDGGGLICTEAATFGLQFFNRTDRALAIIDRMIVNGGKFNP